MKKIVCGILVLLIYLTSSFAQDFSEWSEITPNNISQIKEIYSIDINIPVSDPKMLLFTELLDFDVENNLALIGYAGDKTVMWDMTTKTSLYEISTPYIRIADNSGYTITTDFTKGITQIADEQTNEIIANLKGTLAIFSHDITLMAIADDRFVKVIETKTWSTLFSFSYQSVDNMNFCPDNSCLVVSDFYGQGHVDYWDLTIAEPIKQELVYRTNPDIDTVPGTYLPFTPDGMFLMIPESTKYYVWDMKNQALLYSKDAQTYLLEKPYLKVYAYRDYDFFTLSDIASGEDVLRIPILQFKEINPNGTLIITCNDTKCTVIATDSGEVVYDELPLTRSYLFGDNYIATLNEDGQLIVYGIE